MKKFRLNTKSILITLPRCNASKQECLTAWTDKCKTYEIEDYLIVQEHHKPTSELQGEEGDLHIHAALFLKKRCDWHVATCLDVQEYHGNYQSIKNKEKTIEYLLKEDENPLQSRDWKEWLRNSKQHKKIEKNKEDLELLISKGPLNMVKEGLISYMNLNKAVQNYNTYKQMDEEEKKLEQFEDLPYNIPNPWDLDIKVDIDNKKCHYWIYSTMPNLGKTTWALNLTKTYRVDFWNYLEIYQPQIGVNTEGIVIDEFRGQLKVTQLNQICDGNYWFTAKGRTAWKLSQKPIVFILANRSPGEIYKNIEDVALIEARFNIYNINNKKI